MILFVAPYSPVGRSSHPALGAARKIEIIIEALVLSGLDVVLINTAHNETSRKSIHTRSTSIGRVVVREIVLPTYTARGFGKFLNLFSCRDAAVAVEEIGLPKLIWAYNGYAFESRFARMAKRRWKVPVVLEFEDWHFARGRGLNPKPYVDYVLWRRLAPIVDYCFAVNVRLLDEMGKFGVNGRLLPGIVPPRLVNMTSGREPFSDPKRVRVGYFGGLSAEKGADVVLGMVGRLPENYTLVVTGSGDLADGFKEASSKDSAAIEYHGRVSESVLYEMIESCDVLLNPHSSILNMDGGVFPFKVVEAIASGRVLVSTALPDLNEPALTRGVVVSSGDIAGFVTAVKTAGRFYSVNKDFVLEGARVAGRLYGMSPIANEVGSILMSKLGRGIN